MESKEGKILDLFFNEPTKEWHFEEIIGEAKITRSKADRWLKQLVEEGLVRRIKKQGKMPYYVSHYVSSSYKNRKRLFALKKLYDSGFLNHLASLPKARTVIIFGSFVRSDWYKESDIDLFIYGETEGLKLAGYEMKLNRDIQVFACNKKEDLHKFGEGLIRNIIKGNIVKGDIDFVRVEINA